jgi:iron(III) transport system permease protein
MNWVEILWNTLLIAVLVSLFSTTLGFLVGWGLLRAAVPGVGRLQDLISANTALPSFLMAIAWIVLANPNVGWIHQWIGGPLFPLYSIAGIVFVEVSILSCIVFWALRPALIQFDPSWEEAARLSGGSLWRTWTLVTWPILKRPLLRSAILSFLGSTASFGVPAMLGAPSGIQVFTTAIYSLTKQADANSLNQAALLSIGLGALAFAMAMVMMRLREAAPLSRKLSQITRWNLNRGRRIWGVGLWLFFGISTMLPLVALMISSLLADPSDFSSWTLQHWSRVFFQLSGVQDAIRNSLIFSATASTAIVTGTLGLAFVSLRYPSARFFDALVFILYSLPGSVLALGLIYLSIRFGWGSSGALLLITAYVLKFSLLSQNTLVPAIGAIDRNCFEAARIAGAGLWNRLLWIWLPLLKPALFSAFLVVFMSVFSELTMSVLLYGPGGESVGVYLFQLQEYADRSAAAVLAVLLAAALMSGQWFVRRFTHA